MLHIGIRLYLGLDIKKESMDIMCYDKLTGSRYTHKNVCERIYIIAK